MAGQDFNDWQRDMMSTLDGAGFTRQSYEDVVKRLHVLEFHMDRKGENIVSQIDGVIAFIDRGYFGERVEVGDVWLCSAVLRGTVYYVMPLKKITSSMILGLSDRIRGDVIETLWKAHRREFEKVFEDRYREEVHAIAYEQASAESRALVEELQKKVRDLEMQVEHSRMVIEGHVSRQAAEGIELTSEEVEEGEVLLDPGYTQAVPQEQAPQMRLFHQPVTVPGMPEMRRADAQGPMPQQVGLLVERVTEETIRCDRFPDGKYFVHISPSCKFVVVRRHDYGSAICVNGRIRLEGLAAYSEFTGRRQLMAEYSPHYDGVLIHL